MIKEAIATGDSVEQAFEAACKMLGVESHTAEFEILELPGKKKFGLFGGTPAKVRAFIKESPAKAAAEYLKKILAEMGLTAVEIGIEDQEGGALLSLTGDDIGFIIGHRGETLDALQYLAGLVANHVEDTYFRITLDIGNYREKRKETLETLGMKMAAKAVKTERNCSLEPMNPYERRIIHTAVQTVPGAKSWSEGEETNRHVVIGPEAGEKPLPPRRNNFNNKGGGYRGNNNNRGGSSGGYRGNNNGGSRPPRRDGPAPARPASQAPVQPTQPAESKAAPKTVGAPLYGRIDPKK